MIKTQSPLQGVDITFHELPGEMRQAVLEEYKSKGIVPSSRPPKPTHKCYICKNDKTRRWIWSSLSGGWMCLGCLSPSDWTSKPLLNSNIW